jgi:hypothetical protein
MTDLMTDLLTDLLTDRIADRSLLRRSHDEREAEPQTTREAQGLALDA